MEYDDWNSGISGSCLFCHECRYRDNQWICDERGDCNHFRVCDQCGYSYYIGLCHECGDLHSS